MSQANICPKTYLLKHLENVLAIECWRQDTFRNCRRPPSSLKCAQHITKITNLCKFLLIFGHRSCKRSWWMENTLIRIVCFQMPNEAFLRFKFVVIPFKFLYDIYCIISRAWCWGQGHVPKGHAARQYKYLNGHRGQAMQCNDRRVSPRLKIKGFKLDPAMTFMLTYPR